MTVYIGIDHGYGFMKTVHHTFRNGVDQVWSKPAFGQNAVTYDGKYYIVGESGKAYLTEKTKNNDYYILTLAAIAKELKTRKCGNQAEVVLGAGLPIDYWQAQRKEFREYLMQNRTVSFQFAEEEYQVMIVDAGVYPQGYAAVVKKLQDYPSARYVIDGGSGTVIRLKIANKVPVMTQSESMDKEVGLLSCLDTVKREIRKAFGKSFDDDILMNVMRKGDKLLPPEIQVIAENVIKSYTEKIRGILLQAYPDMEYVGTTWCGGLAQVMKTHGTYGDKDEFMLELNANARGFEYLAEKMGRK